MIVSRQTSSQNYRFSYDFPTYANGPENYVFRAFCEKVFRTPLLAQKIPVS